MYDDTLLFKLSFNPDGFNISSDWFDFWLDWRVICLSVLASTAIYAYRKYRKFK